MGLRPAAIIAVVLDGKGTGLFDSRNNAPFRLAVMRVRQNSSGGSHVVIFEASVHLEPDAAVQISVEHAELMDAHPTPPPSVLTELVAEHIRLGIQDVVSPRGHGASVVVERLVIHPVDCKPDWYRRCAAWELSAQLGAKDAPAAGDSERNLEEGS